MKTLEQAKAYAERGWSVIPLHGKRPAIEWKEFQTRRAEIGELQEWFYSQFQNIGVVTGSISNLTVVDCDSREEAEWFWRNVSHANNIVETAKGFHFYFTHEGSGNRQGVHGRKIDIRGEGGYVVAPCSIHQTGKPYTWKRTGELDKFNTDWLPEKVTALESVSDEATREIILRARKWISHIWSIEGEGGDKQLFRAACGLVQKFNLPESVALDELRAWNNLNSVPPWDDGRLRHKISEAFKTKG